jgi:beta-glucosidase
MNKKPSISHWPFRLLAMLVLAATNPSVSKADDTLPAYRNSSLSVDERVKDLVGRMTIEEKARQLDIYHGKKELLNKNDVQG